MASELLGSTKEILVAVDAEGHARIALQEALFLGRILGRHVHVVHAVETARRFSQAVSAREFENARGVAMERIRRWMAELNLEGQAPTVQILHGHPVQAILEITQERKPAILVVGRHGAGRRADVLLGTTAARLVRAAPCPVLVRRNARTPGRPVLVPVDMSRESLAALEVGAHLAKETDAHLDTLFVYQPPDFVYSPEEIKLNYAVEAERERILKEYREGVSAKGLPVPARTLIAEGDPGEAIINRAKEIGADLVVMGTHGRTGLARWALGSVAEAIVDRSELSVLAMKVQDRDFLV